MQRPVVRRRQQQRAARAQHAAHLRQPRRDVGDVLDDLARPDDVDARVVERQRLAGAPQAQRRGPARARARARSASARDVDGDRLRARAARSAALNSPAPQPRSSTRSPGALPEQERAPREALGERVVGHARPSGVVEVADNKA